MSPEAFAPSPVAEIGRSTVSIRNVSKFYGRHVAIDDVSIDVEEGSFVTLLGPSGSGKTTILMSIAGFVKPDRGRILLGQKDVTDLPPERRNLGMMFQGYALFPHMTVEENVWFPLRVRGVSRSAAQEKIRKTLDLVQMAHLAGRVPAELSGGQQQRVALARSLVFEPGLLLLDEPLSALDKALRTGLQWELKALHRRLGATFVNVTHDQEEALSISDRIVILKDGRIEQSGSPAELYNHPKTRFVASFLGESNFFHGTAASVSSDRFSYTAGPSLLVQAGRPDIADGADVLVSLRPENITASMEKPDAVNAVHGRIAEYKYVGSSFFLQVDTEELGRIMARIPARGAGIDPESPAPIWLSWDPDASLVVDER